MRAQSLTDVLETESMIRRESKINTNFIQLASPISSMHSLLHAHTCILRCPLSEMPPTRHHFRPSSSPVVSLSLGMLHEWMRTQMLAKPSSNLLRRTGGDHWGGRARLGWRTFMMTCLRWILGYMRLEIWRKIGLSADWCLCTALHTCSGACYCWTGLVNLTHGSLDLSKSTVKPHLGQFSHFKRQNKCKLRN